MKIECIECHGQDLIYIDTYKGYICENCTDTESTTCSLPDCDDFATDIIDNTLLCGECANKEVGR